MVQYNNFLKGMSECPFCLLIKDEIVLKNSTGKVILAKAPYHKDHLLVVSNKHVGKISELTKSEKLKLFELIIWAEGKLKKLHNNLSILYREGKNTGKSISHIHIHLIPDEKIGSLSKNNSDREIFSDKKYIRNTLDFKRRIK